MPSKQFTWKSYSVGDDLPDAWAEDILKCARSHFKEKFIVPTSVTSREESTSIRLRAQVVGGRTVSGKLPWLFDLYHGLFLDLASTWAGTEVFPAEDNRYAVNLNIQQGNDMRYECHVDSNPVEGLLYVTDHPKGTGGELVVANNPLASGCREIDRDGVRIYPKSGDLVFFNACKHPHYVTSLNSHTAILVVVAMNYYTTGLPESSRPADLNRHLGIE